MSPKLILFIFCVLLFLYGIYIFLGALRNWKSFIKKYKKIDLIEIFGDFGRVLYMIIGVFISIISMLYLAGILELGPFSKYLTF
jgi:hypothetical protein